MNIYKPNNIKSIVLLGHQGSGKTSLVEALLHRAGNIAKKGNINDGTTVSDFTKEEKNSKFSIYSSVIPVEYDNNKFNFIDTPGFFDFEMEAIGALRAARNAVIVVDAVKGIEVGTRKAYRLVREHCVPTAIFVNKMDKENIKLDELKDAIFKQFEKKAIPFTWPIGLANEHKGYIHTIDMTASIDNKVCDVPAEYMDLATELHSAIVEAAANYDDALLEKFFAEEPISVEELIPALKKAVIGGSIIPVIFGSTEKNSGVKGLLDILKNYFPDETVKKVSFGGQKEIIEDDKEVSENGPFSAIVFKTMVDPFVGKISFIKVLTGAISKDDTILNANAEVEERINNISLMRGKEVIESSTITAGDIGVISKVASIESGNTICDPKAVVKYADIKRIEPTIYFAVEVKNKNDEGKITDALRKICSEDLSITADRNAETKQLLLGCQGQAHIDNVVNKLQNLYNIGVTLGDAKVSYRETIKGNSDVEGRYVKQSGGAGSFGVVRIKFSHSENDELEFVNSVFGGAVPTNFIPCVEKGLKESMSAGVLAGFPVLGVRAELYDGKSHPVDSKPLSFEMAASLAFKDGCKKASPALLEPIMEIKVVAPNEYIGDVMGDLSKRRGIIMGIEPVGEEQYVTAEVPQSELTKYIIDLKTMTQAQGTFTMKFIRYDEVPSNLVDKIIAENKPAE